MVAEVKCILIQLLTATAYLHENFIIHRDLKVISCSKNLTLGKKLIWILKGNLILKIENLRSRICFSPRAAFWRWLTSDWRGFSAKKICEWRRGWLRFGKNCFLFVEKHEKLNFQVPLSRASAWFDHSNTRSGYLGDWLYSRGTTPSQTAFAWENWNRTGQKNILIKMSYYKFTQNGRLAR